MPARLPLTKSFELGLHYDAEGHLTLHAVDTKEHAELHNDRSLTQLRAMRSSRSHS